MIDTREFRGWANDRYTAGKIRADDYLYFCKLASKIDLLRIDNDNLRAALARLCNAARAVANQIICLGGDEICQPCEARERLLAAIEKAEQVIKGEA